MISSVLSVIMPLANYSSTFEIFNKRHVYGKQSRASPKLTSGRAREAMQKSCQAQLQVSGLVTQVKPVKATRTSYTGEGQNRAFSMI